MKSRQENNLEICQKLTEFFSDPNHSDVRFFQALSSMNLYKNQYDEELNIIGIEDPFYIESSKTNQEITNFLTRYKDILKK